MYIKPPSPYEIKNKYLEMEYKNMQVYFNLQREKETNGCTIMFHEWIRLTKLSIINFITYSKGTTIFFKSIDASNIIKNHKYIYGFLKSVINVVE